MPKSLLDILGFTEMTPRPRVRVLQRSWMIWDIGQEKGENKLHAGPSWKRSQAHDFILKWQEKQNTLKQSFSNSPNSSGCIENCWSVQSTANWHLHMQMSYKCEGPNLGLCVPGQRDRGGTCLFLDCTFFRRWFPHCQLPWNYSLPFWTLNIF